ncbi:hypothetical protein D3C86_1081560 [compost metagenome]
MRLDADHAGIGAGQRYAVADADQGKRHEKRIGAFRPGRDQHHGRDDARNGDDIARQHHAGDADFAGITAGNEVAEHIAAGHEEELQAEQGRCKPVKHAADKGRAAEEGEEHA